jgi:hypothetical protein
MNPNQRGLLQLNYCDQSQPNKHEEARDQQNAVREVCRLRLLHRAGTAAHESRGSVLEEKAGTRTNWYPMHCFGAGAAENRDYSHRNCDQSGGKNDVPIFYHRPGSIGII